MSVVDFVGCPFPDLNGKIILSAESRQKNNFPDNSKAVVECARGHEREEGSDVIICRSGKWSDPELKCKSNLVLTSFLNWAISYKKKWL